jgi:hypothetical protein
MGNGRMSSPSWGWIAAKATGTSHTRSGRGCDDFGGCAVVHCAEQNVLVLVVSDGAGSAEHSAMGSRLATIRFARCAFAFLKSGGNVSSLSQQTALDWLDDIRDRIAGAAEKIGASPRDFAATLVGCLVSPSHATFIHVGDGAVVFRLVDAEEWQIGSWPSHGEYASTTYFVTDDPEPRVTISHVHGAVGEVAIFSDGIERLVLEFSNQTAFAPFFNKVFSPLDGSSAGRNRLLSRHLNNLLESPSVCEKTDDDKTLFLAKRT